MILTQTALVLLLSMLGGDERTREAEIERLIAQGSRAIPALVRVLEEGRWQARGSAMEALEGIGEAALPMLIEIARNHPEIDSRRTAILALGRVLGASRCDSLRGFTTGEDRGIGVTAMGAASCFPKEVAVLLTDRDPDVRRRAIGAYAETMTAHPDEANVERLTDRLSDVDRAVREAAAVSLARLNPSALVDALPPLETSRVIPIRALEGRVTQSLVEPLKHLLGSATWAEQAAIVDVLGSSEAGRSVLRQIDLSRLHPFVVSRIDRALESGRDG